MARYKTKFDETKDVLIEKVGFIESSKNGTVIACAIRSYNEHKPKIALVNLFPSSEGKPYIKPIARLSLNDAKIAIKLLTKAIKVYEDKVDLKKYENKGIAKPTFNPSDYM